MPVAMRKEVPQSYVQVLRQDFWKSILVQQDEGRTCMLASRWAVECMYACMPMRVSARAGHQKN